jgi:hypothetical protein
MFAALVMAAGLSVARAQTPSDNSVVRFTRKVLCPTASPFRSIKTVRKADPVGPPGFQEEVEQ